MLLSTEMVQFAFHHEITRVSLFCVLSLKSSKINQTSLRLFRPNVVITGLMDSYWKLFIALMVSRNLHIHRYMQISKLISMRIYHIYIKDNLNGMADMSICNCYPTDYIFYFKKSYSCSCLLLKDFGPLLLALHHPTRTSYC